MHFVFGDFAVLQLADQSGSTERDFVEVVAAVHDQHALGTEALHDAHLNADEVGMEDAHQGVRGAGRVS